MRILAVGGGSGGHVTPVVAVLNALDERQKTARSGQLEARFVCDQSFEVQARAIMKQADVAVKVSTVTAGKLRRYRHFRPVDYLTSPRLVLRNLTDLFKVLIGLVQSLWLLLRWRPDVVFAKGGYVCLPVGLAAWLLRVPLVLHDSDARPGLTSRILARYARRIATGYPLENYPYDERRSRYTGVPIRPQFSPVSTDRQAAAKASQALDPAAPLVVALGGRLGARAINQAMLMSAPGLLEAGVSIIIVTGKQHYDEMTAAAAGLVGSRFKLIDFISQGMDELLAAGDIIVTRASATSLQELAGLEKPVIAVPARSLSDQHKNAAVYRKADAAIVLDDDQIATSGVLQRHIETLLADPKRRAELAQRLHAFARPEAARDVAKLIEEAAKA